jgi:sugar O-acyltransferase (sialic acid O-acetyltransferase NeuD family)
MNQLFIIGAGSVGIHLVLNTALYNLTDFNICLLDNDETKVGQNLFGVPVVGTEDYLRNIDENISLIIAISNPKIRKSVYERWQHKENFDYPSLVAKNSWISREVTYGKGVLIYPGVCINHQTIIGDFAIINMNCAIGHDCELGNFISLAPGVNFAGGTTVGDLCDIGIGSSTRQNVQIEKGVQVGGNAMIIHNIEKNTVVGGVPAKRIK